MIYLDNGATSFPKPKGMILSMEKCMLSYCGNPGRSGHDMSMKAGEKVYECRSAVGKLFNVKDPSGIVFTMNATEALNMGLKGVLERGDHVVTTSMEHNSVLRPLKSLENYGVTFTVLRADSKGKIKADDVMDAVRSNTRMIVCTAASNVTGTIMPIKELGQAVKAYNSSNVNGGGKRLLFMVDGSQGCGVMDIDVQSMNIDILAAPGHKSLLGPLGTGVLCVDENVKLKSLIQGGTGTASRSLRQPLEMPEGYESGTVNVPGIAGLCYSVKYISRLGIENIRRREAALTEMLDEGLCNINGVILYGPSSHEKVGISLINIAGLDCEEAAAKLNDEYGIAVRSGFHCAGLAHKSIGTWDTGAIRLSVGIFNTKKDVVKTLDAIEEICQKKIK